MFGQLMAGMMQSGGGGQDHSRSMGSTASAYNAGIQFGPSGQTQNVNVGIIAAAAVVAVLLLTKRTR